MSSLRNVRANSLPQWGGADACGFASNIAKALTVTEMTAGLMGANPGSRDPGGGGTF